MHKKKAILALADGTVFVGQSIGASGQTVGELVFNTSMTGYQEMLTDPSYAQQIITLTVAHVGNTGCNEEDLESSRIWAAGLVVRNYSLVASNYRSDKPLSEWLRANGVIAISDIDTRQLTIYLREKGAVSACISTYADKPQEAIAMAQHFSGLNGVDLAAQVSRHTMERWDQGRGTCWGGEPKPLHYHIVAYDFGIKHNILRILTDKGCHITLVPAMTTAEEVLALNPDGVLLSNGPGDPMACTYAIKATQSLLENNVPLLGICLGFQILSLAAGGRSAKMKFGHHGANHPVAEAGGAKRVFITSQNHGFTITEDSLPDCWEITHRSLFDDSLQGIRHRHKPAIAFQGHPEASPGPHDIETIFDEFIAMMSKHKQ